MIPIHLMNAVQNVYVKLNKFPIEFYFLNHILYMVYKKRSNKRSAPVKLTGLQSAMATAKKALDLALYIKGMVNCEKKYKDTTATGAIDYNGSIDLLSGIAQGNDDDGRSGDSILVRSDNFKLEWAVNATAGITTARTIIFYDNKNIGTAPTVSQILQSVGSVFSVHSPLNRDSNGRFKILMDKTVTLNINGQASKNINKFLKLYFHQKFTGPNTTDISDKALYMLNICDQAVNTPTITMYNRMGYYDN